jgi:hypothetical protein
MLSTKHTTTKAKSNKSKGPSRCQKTRRKTTGVSMFAGLPASRLRPVVLLTVLLGSLFFVAFTQAVQTISIPLISPSCGWGIFAGTVGNIEIRVDQPGIAVRVEIPREFLNGRRENDTSFLSSDISSDYYYYSLIDQSLHYSHQPEAPGYRPDFSPYDPNAPYTVEIWSHDGIRFVEFTPPRHVWMRKLVAPTVAGRYEFLVYIAEKRCERSGRPLFPKSPTQTLSINVSMGPLPATISGSIIDPLTQPMLPIRAKGVVYALDKAGKPVARSFVDNNTGFFKMTGLLEGDYTLEASAGYCTETGYSYMPTRFSERVRILRGGNLTLSIPLKRGCIIRGSVKYTNPNGNPIASLSHLWNLGLDRATRLNYTVQALTEKGEVFASFSAQATGSNEDQFVLADSAEITHVGYPTVGTAYSGFPPGKYVIKAWVFGYVQRRPIVITVTSNAAEKGEITLVTGGAIAGEISFRDPRTLEPQTPRTAERLNFATSTGTLYGGNILASAYDSMGELAAVTLIQGTMPNGTTAYADHSVIRFQLIGFSESLNRTYSGVWKRRDYGIASGTYAVKVHVRGYRQPYVTKVSVIEGRNSSCNLMLVSQSAVSFSVTSMATSGGVGVQVPWAHKGLTPESHLRVYVHEHDGSDVGYVETRINSNTPVTSTPLLNFTGRNCTLEDITYQGYVPNSITEGTYTLRAYTFGYVQRQNVTVMVSGGSAVQARVQLYRGLNVNCTVRIRAGDFLSSLTEDVEARIEALESSGARVAAALTRSYAGAGSFSFTLMGLRGAGHFFYVTASGDRLKDYGLQAGKYMIKVYDFGDEWRYHVQNQITIQIPMSGTTHIFANRMSKIFGRVWGMTSETQIPLSWVKIAAGNEISFSVDGKYTLHLQEGIYQVVFSLPGYLEKSVNCTATGVRAVELDVTLNPV